MKDADIRNALHSVRLLKYKKEPDTLVIDELGLCQGMARIDIAVVNGSLHGYEIKSDKDTLERLAFQQEIYNRTLDSVTLVVGKKYAEKVQKLIPKWWGILRAEYEITDKDLVRFVEIREAKKNPNVDSFSLAQLLWKDEVLSLLKDLNLNKGLSNKPRIELWKRLSDSLTVEQINFYVRKTLKMRQGWRAAQ